MDLYYALNHALAGKAEVLKTALGIFIHGKTIAASGAYIFETVVLQLAPYLEKYIRYMCSNRTLSS